MILTLTESAVRSASTKLLIASFAILDEHSLPDDLHRLNGGVLEDVEMLEEVHDPVLYCRQARLAILCCPRFLLTVGPQSKELSKVASALGPVIGDTQCASHVNQNGDGG